ncbi:protein ROOT INITIATION DEFECTIVE 3, partial [Cryptomeria japonica]|uniref:protein ROOT INITIATION DEFECTIVE 3 n=1 Tax=Cryptomeria japonica TaxID=3369 RepID=UPI0027DA583D
RPLAVSGWDKLASPGEVVVVASPVDAGITGWDLATGAERVHLRSCSSSRHGLAAVGLHFVAASQIQKTSTSASGAIFCWAWNKPQAEIRSFPVEPIGPIACNSDGTYIVGGGSSGRIYLWEIGSGRLLRVWPAHYKAVTRLIFSDDESLLISGAEDGFVRAWPLLIALDEEAAFQAETHFQPLHNFSAHTLPVTDIVCGYGGCSAIIVSCSLDFTCKIWSLALGILLRTVKFPAAVNAVVLDPGEYALYAGCTDGKIYIATLNAGTTTDSIHGDGIVGTLVDHSRAVTALAFSMDGVLLVSGSEDCTVRVWDTVSCQVLRIFKHTKGPINTLIMVSHSQHQLPSNNQGNLHHKRGSFLSPLPLNKYKEPRNPDCDNGPPVILPSYDTGFMDRSCYNTIFAINQQIKELQEQGSSTATQMELERLRSEHQRSLNIIKQWQQVYQDLHYFCVNELMGGNKVGEEDEDANKHNEKVKKARTKIAGRK